MHIFQTNKGIFIIGMKTLDQCLLGCCPGVFILTLKKHLSDKFYQYTNYDSFLDYSQELYQLLSLIVHMTVVQAAANLHSL